MRTYAALMILLALLVGILASLRPIESSHAARGKLSLGNIEAKSFQAAAFAISDEVRRIASVRRPNIPASTRSSPKVIEPSARFTHKGLAGDTTDTLHDEDDAVGSFSKPAMPFPSLSFDGLSNFDNLALFGVFFLPPDTIGDVGPGHYVQAVNSLLRIFDKNGNPLTTAFKISDIFAPLGTACSTRNDGEPNVLYDPLADRWLISQYCNNFPPFRQMVAVSTTGDPLGTYYIYEFVMPNIRLNDFAKFGVWPDGYYMSTEEYYGSDFTGSGIFAFDRAKLLIGDPSASFVYLSVPIASTARISGFLPADMDGLTAPPANSPNVFTSYTATEYGNAQDALRFFDFHVDFTNPTQSTFTERPESPLAVAAFDPTSPAGRADIFPPAPGEALDSNSDRLMYRAAYRNFGSYESLVLNQTVRLTPQDQTYRAGIRIYELQRTGTEFAVQNQATIGDTTSSRWIGAAAQDHKGNLAVGYNFVTDEKVPQLMYTGKLASEPPGQFRQEAMLVNGTGVQTTFGFRWGDLGGMSVDPVDDCTFWMTGEYFSKASQEFSDFTWLTRIGRFKFEECKPAPRGKLTITVLNDATGQPIENAAVNVYGQGNLNAAPYFRQTRGDGSTGEMILSPGPQTITAESKGFRAASVDVIVSQDAVTSAVVRLFPVPVIEISGSDFTAESCATDHASEPGETVTINVGFRNVGHINTRRLQVELLNTSGVSSTEPRRNVGIMLPNGVSVMRPFTFTVAPDVHCGDPLTLTFRLIDGRQSLGDAKLTVQTGVQRIAFSENFDGVTAPNLPQGWTASSAGLQQNWTVSGNRKISAPNSAFSPDPNQMGVNELVSPVIAIGTTDARLSFQNYYDLEATFLRNKLYDGSVLEIRIGGGDWQDILAAGAAFESGGYDGLLDSCCQNPLAGRMGWSGTSGPNRPAAFITTTVKLPAAAAGQNVQFRWRVGTDVGTFKEGQYIDDIVVSDGNSCSCQTSASVRGRF